MTMSKVILIVSDSHPLSDVLLKSPYPVMKVDEIDLIRLSDFETVFDFTLGTRQVKEKMLEQLNDLPQITVASDLSCYHGHYLVEKYSSLQAAFAAAFYSPKNCIELYAKSNQLYLMIEQFFKSIHIQTFRVQSPGIGFIFPRTISMIINEAFYTWEQEIADPKNIDQAMLYGVNYPIGPFEWVKKIGPSLVTQLLQELFHVTKNERYLVCRLLTKDLPYE